MEQKQCLACGQHFRPRPQVPDQCYCSAPACQQKRRRQWHRDKLKNDPDYRDNQSRAQQAWMKRNPHYWRQYRQQHPEYLERNRIRQQVRNQAQKPSKVVKMDVSKPAVTIPVGTYELTRLCASGIAKIDVWMVQLRLISPAGQTSGENCKEMT